MRFRQHLRLRLMRWRQGCKMTPARSKAVIGLFALVFSMAACSTTSGGRGAQPQQPQADSSKLEPLADRVTELSTRLANIEHSIEAQRPLPADALRLSRLQDSVRRCLAAPTQPAAWPLSNLPKMYYFWPGMTSWGIAQESMHGPKRRAYFKIMEACPPCKQDFARLEALASAGLIQTPVTIVVQSGDRNIAFNLATGSYFVDSRLVDYVWDHEGEISESLGVPDAPSWALQDQGRVVERFKGVSKQRSWQTISSFLAKPARQETAATASDGLAACIWDALNESHDNNPQDANTAAK